MKKLSFLFAMVFLLAGCSTVSVGGLGGGLDLLTRTATAAGKASRPISDEEEYYVGRAVAARLLATYPLLENDGLTGYVNSIGQTIALHSDKPFTHGGYHFAILDTDELNAFACPGGTIFITKGMLGSVQNEDELAAVLAHEIAHVNHRDGIDSIKSSRWTEAVTIIGTEAVSQYGPAQLSQLVSIFEGSIDDVFKTLVVNGYGKTQEREADTTALVYLSRSGYDPGSLKGYLGRLVEQGGSSEEGILTTHPPTKERIENVDMNMPSAEVDPAFVTKRTERFGSRI